MVLQHIPGRNVGHIVLYALSTCPWCRKTKQLLSDLGVDYDYIDVDLLEGSERDRVAQILRRWNPSRSFPTLVIDDTKCIVGFKEDEIREALKS